jgi:uncharacterized NAD(P)/FAD-binding protein YdhS
VVNCTGAQQDVRKTGDPLLHNLLRTGQARPGPAGLGLDTMQDGRILAVNGQKDSPLRTLGALRAGNLWETTAFPEIRQQADQVAAGVLAMVDPGKPIQSQNTRDMT